MQSVCSQFAFEWGRVGNYGTSKIVNMLHLLPTFCQNLIDLKKKFINSSTSSDGDAEGRQVNYKMTQVLSKLAFI